MKVARWMIANNMWERQKYNETKELAKLISLAAGRAAFKDDTTGETVRKYHAFQLGEDQPMLWADIHTISPQNMKASINARRDKLVGGAVKAIIDAEYFNTHHNPGDPIKFETDLTFDVKEKRMPGLYDDSGPTDGPEDQPPTVPL